MRGRPTRTLACLFAGGIALFQATQVLPQPIEPLQLVQTIVLPDVRGRIDHLDIDLEGGRLFVAAMGNNTVEIIDLKAGRRSARIQGLHEPQGIAYVPEARRLFVANGEGGSVEVFAGDTLTAVGRIDTLEDADNVRYEPLNSRLYVGYGSALAVLEAPTMQLLGRIKLAGHPESFQLENGGSRIFVNVPNAQQIAVVDRKNGNAIATWSLGEARANFPMALDDVEHRLFVAMRRPTSLLVYDTETGKRIASVPIGGDADDLFFDRERKQVYAICGEGIVEVVQRRGADRYLAIGSIRTVPGARTGLFVPKQSLLYVALPAQRSAPAEIRVYKVK